MTFHRTFGETRDCRGCRYWSEMIAMSHDSRGVRALCLSPDGPRSSDYTMPRDTCPAWKSGHLGAVDDPPGDVDYRGEPDELPTSPTPPDGPANH